MSPKGPASRFRSSVSGAARRPCAPRLGAAALLSVVLASCLGSSEEPVAPESAAGERSLATAPPQPAGDGKAESERTVTRLVEEFDVVAKNGTTTEEAQEFIREHEARLTRIYVDDYAELSPETRLELINLLVSFQSQATAPAHAAAIARYAEREATVDEAIWACQAAKKIKSTELAAALMKAFNAIDMSERDDQRFGRHLADAMEFNAVSSWSRTLEKHRDATPEPPGSFEDKRAVRRYRNQRYWQETSVRLLERLGKDDAE